MAGRNYLEEMRFKKQPKPQPNIQFRIDKPKTKNPVGKKTSTTDEPGSPLSFDDKPSTDKPRRPTLVPSSGVLAKATKPPLEKTLDDNDNESDTDIELQGEQRKAFKMNDLRGKVPVNYELIFQRLHGNKPMPIGMQAPTTVPVITKTKAKIIISSDDDNNEEPPSKKADTEPTIKQLLNNEKSQTSKNEDDDDGVSEKESDNIPKPPVEEPAPKPVKIIKKKIVIMGKLDDKLPGPKEVSKGEPAKKPRGRQTKKLQQGIAIKLTKAEVARRMPKQEKIVVRTSQYYMNNRKLYVQKMKDLFSKYEKELEEMGEIASCAKDPSGEFSPLTHQKIVRDYLNLYTPYRGLLLYHGLGAGKTCTSIGIAEGMKSAKEIVLMTPASLATNFFTEIKKCGDILYRKNQFWEFVGIEGQPDNIELLSKALSLSRDFIEKKQGAWMVDAKKPPNFKELSTADQESIDEQLDKMIRAKYTDIHYNGMNRRILNEMTQNGKINPFDNKTVIIDEVHNFVSRIVNKLDSKKTDVISKELYNYLLKANNARIVVLSGTPIINSPHELSVLYNILRGGIRTWTIPVRLPDGPKITKDDILDMLNNPPQGLPAVAEYDYVEFSDNKITITRNPIGFVNTKRREVPARGGAPEETFFSKLFGGGGKKKQTKKSVKSPADKPPSDKRKTKKHSPKTLDGDYSAYEIANGVLKIKDVPKESISPEEDIDVYQRTGHDLHKDGGGLDEFEKYAGVRLDESGYVSDDQFLDVIKRILRANDIEVLDKMMKGQPKFNLALPDDSSVFEEMFLDKPNKSIKNDNVFKRRILGLTSYFRSAQESLLPQFEMNGDSTYHIERAEMSEHQLYEYTKKRLIEKDMELNAAMNASKKEAAAAAGQDPDLFEDASTYRVGSREVSNFSFPDNIERPIPDKKQKPGAKAAAAAELEKEIAKMDAAAKRKAGEPEIAGEKESITLDSVDDENDKTDDSKYMDRIKLVLKELAYNPAKSRTTQYLTKEGNLGMLSPKMLKMMENIQNPDNRGLHLVYSQFRHIEGIGIFKLILEANGYAELRIKSVPGAESWELVENEEDVGKPKFALYTGTESEEEKEIIRNIYNGDWGFVPKSIVDKLEKISSNNLYGEVIKVLMITAAGAEGINLRNTRYVHITEPYWHNTRLEQVIGRASRICSHEQLPEDMRTIKVFLYISVIGEDLLPKLDSNLQTGDLNPDDQTKVETTDEYLLRRAVKKETVNKTFLKAIKESAMDCTLYKNKEGLMCYGVGMAKNPGNQYLSYPTVEQDMAERDDLNVKKTTLKLTELKIEIRGVKYAIDKATDNLYDLAKYKNGNIVLVGKLIRPGKGRTGYDIQFLK
jgi:hypothetical protein